MAYGLTKISPLDLKPSTAIGVKIPFQAKNVFSSVYTTKEQLKYNIINFLLTDRRETPFVSNFGAGLRSFLFEQITVESNNRLQDYIVNSVQSNFPTIQVDNISIESDEDRSSITINFSYVLKYSKETDSIIIKIDI
jgi:hypothetical protein